MPRMPILFDAYDRTLGNMPSFPIVNMYAEDAPTEDGGVVLQSQPGLEARGLALGTGSISTLFKADGVLGSALFIVTTAPRLYNSAYTNLGSLDGAGPFFVAGFEDRIFIAGGGSLWGYNGVTLAAIAFPDSANVTKVVVGASRAVCIRKDTGKFYWSDVLSNTIDALSFATAESQPDRLRDMLFMDDILILFSAETVEFWPNTGDANLPFQPLEGRVFETGIKATGCATQFGTTFAWVTSDNQVCVSDPENVISKPWLQAKIAASASVSLWTFFLDGVEFLALRLATTTYVFSQRSRMWSEFNDYPSNWRVGCYAAGVFGSATDTELYDWGSTAGSFNVGTRSFRAGIPLNSGGATIDNVVLRTNAGQTYTAGGANANPLVEMRISKDGGNTWGSWRSASLGTQGQYRQKVQWTACGMIGQPGGLFEFRLTYGVKFRVSGVYYNEPYGGI